MLTRIVISDIENLHIFRYVTDFFLGSFFISYFFATFFLLFSFYLFLKTRFSAYTYKAIFFHAKINKK